MNKNLHYLFVMIAMCGLVGCAIGITMGTAGLFYSFIAKDLGISQGTISFMYTITAIASAFAGLAIPIFLRRENLLKPLIIAGVVMNCGGTFLLSIASNVFLLYLFSIIRGVGSGLLSFVLATSVINNWFYARNGLMVSIAMAFSGLPGVLLSNVFTGVIEKSGWRFGYVFVTIVMILFCLPGVLLPVKFKPQQLDLQPYGYEDYLKYREENKDKVVVDLKDDHISLLSPDMFSLIGFTIFACTIAGVLQHLPSFAISLGFAASIGALMSSLASASNIVSKLLYGALTDKIGPYKSSLLASIMNLVAISMLLLIHTNISMLVGSFLFGFTFANSSTALSIMTRDIFGMGNYTRVYPLVSFIGAMANAIAVTLLGVLYDATGSYTVVFLLCLVLQLAAFGIVVMLQRRQKAIA